jgi:hypothetical protein
MFKIIEHVPCAELDDIERFQAIIQKAIDQGKVEEFAKFRKVSKAQLAKKRKRAEKEAIEAQEAKKKMDHEAQDMDALKSLIQNKQKDRLSNMINSLEEKYVNQEKERKKAAKGMILLIKNKRKELENKRTYHLLIFKDYKLVFLFPIWPRPRGNFCKCVGIFPILSSLKSLGIYEHAAIICERHNLKSLSGKLCGHFPHNFYRKT